MYKCIYVFQSVTRNLKPTGPKAEEKQKESVCKPQPQPASANLSDVCCRSIEEIAAQAAANKTASSVEALNLPAVVASTRDTIKIPDDFILSVGVLTVSDRAAAGEYQDLSGPAIEKALTTFGSRVGFSVTVISRKIVPDDKEKIASVIRSWADEVEDVKRGTSGPPGLILTTGGTGFSSRDVTPEATKEAVDRLALGIAAAVTLQSARTEPFALLSRAVAGIRKRSFVFNLPGRPKAVEENLAIAIPTLVQAVYQLRL